MGGQSSVNRLRDLAGGQEEDMGAFDRGYTKQSKKCSYKKLRKISVIHVLGAFLVGIEADQLRPENESQLINRLQNPKTRRGR